MYPAWLLRTGTLVLGALADGSSSRLRIIHDAGLLLDVCLRIICTDNSGNVRPMSSLSGVKQTSRSKAATSVYDPKSWVRRR